VPIMAAGQRDRRRKAESCGSPKLSGSVGNGGVSGKGSKRDPPSARRCSYTVTTAKRWGRWFGSDTTPIDRKIGFANATFADVPWKPVHGRFVFCFLSPCPAEM